MKKQTKKLSLEGFKAKAKTPSSQDLLDKISGGVMDDCHVKPKGPTWIICIGM